MAENRGRSFSELAFAICVSLSLTAAIAVAAVSSQSLWIDEFGTWMLTLAPSWRDWLQQLVNWPNSDTQIPLYHLYMRLWTSVAGATEYSLRIANVPWIALAIAAFWLWPASVDQRGWLRTAGVVVALHPLTWYYVNEARPYAMILAGTSLSTSGMLALFYRSRSETVDRRAISLIIIGCALMAATSVLGAIWTVAFALPAAVILRGTHGWSFGLRRHHLLLSLGIIILASPVFVHYAMSFLRGASPAAMGHKFANFLFAFYEIGGVSGLGPGRFDLRTAGVEALRPYMVPVALALVPIALTLAAGVRFLWRDNRKALLTLAAAAALPVLILYALGEVKQWRVVGRHVIPLIGTFAVLTAIGLCTLWNGDWPAKLKWVARAVGVACLLVLIGSAVLLSRADRHGRDDFKAAAAFAHEELSLGKRVWWAADANGAAYYGLDLAFAGCESRHPVNKAVFTSVTTDREALEKCVRPDTVLVSLRDDQDANIQAFLNSVGYAPVRSWIGFQAFAPYGTGDRRQGS